MPILQPPALMLQILQVHRHQQWIQMQPKVYMTKKKQNFIFVHQLFQISSSTFFVLLFSTKSVHIFLVSRFSNQSFLFYWSSICMYHIMFSIETSVLIFISLFLWQLWTLSAFSLNLNWFINVIATTWNSMWFLLSNCKLYDSFSLKQKCIHKCSILFDLSIGQHSE